MKKLFIEANIPSEERGTVPVLADEKGVVWVFGFGVNKRNSITNETKNAIHIKGEKYDFKNNDD